MPDLLTSSSGVLPEGLLTTPGASLLAIALGAAIVAPAFSTAALQSGIHRAGLAEIPVGEITHPGFRA